MRTMFKTFTLAAGLCLLAATAEAGKPASPGNGKGGPKACDADAVAVAAEAIAAACPCEGVTNDEGEVVPWKNHGKYVRCVAHATKAAVRASDGAVSRRCLKQSVRCAARSTCGKREGVVNCTVETDDGSSCSFRPSADACTADGGVPGTGSCCDPTPIGSPSGAFVDGAAFF